MKIKNIIYFLISAAIAAASLYIDTKTGFDASQWLIGAIAVYLLITKK